jgi:hypothetical protein
MRFIIRTSDHGAPFPLDAVEEKKSFYREKITAAGFDCLEYRAELWIRDASQEAIREPVIILEATSEVSYV